ncbi:MAG TPA: ABC transporter substrate-binding protein [Limnochordales bacterium]
MTARRSPWVLAMALGLAAALALPGGSAMAKQSITFWHIWDAGPAREFIVDTVREFNATHRDIEVKELGINFWDYWTKLQTATAAGISPDVALNDLGNVPQRAATGVIRPLDEFLARDGITLDTFWPATHPAIRWEGRVWALPLETDVRVFYYNKQAFREAGLDPERPPRTWDELVAYSDKLTIRDARGRLVRVGFSPTWGNLYFWTIAWLNGGSFTDAQGRIKIDHPANIEALEWMVERVHAYGIRELSALESNFGGGAMSPFISGKVAMIGENNTFLANIRQYAPDMDFGVSGLPYNRTPASWSNGFSIEISSKTRYPEAAWEFVKFLTSRQKQLQYARINGSMVGNVAAATADELMQDPFWRAIVDQMKVSRFRPFSMEAPTWYDTVLQPEIDNALRGIKTPAQALRDAQKAYEAEVARYRQTQSR